MIRIFVDYRKYEFSSYFEIDYKKYIPTGVYKEVNGVIYIEVLKKSLIPFTSYRFFVCEDDIYFREETYYRCER